MRKDKRFEFVLENDLYRRIANRAAVEGVSVAHVVRELLEKWDRGDVSINGNSRPPIRYKGENDREMFMYADAMAIYRFGVKAATVKMSRIELMQRLMDAVNEGRIDLDDIL